jgi:hypothetical protein
LSFRLLLLTCRCLLLRCLAIACRRLALSVLLPVCRFALSSIRPSSLSGLTVWFLVFRLSCRSILLPISFGFRPAWLLLRGCQTWLLSALAWPSWFSLSAVIPASWSLLRRRILGNSGLRSCCLLRLRPSSLCLPAAPAWLSVPISRPVFAARLLSLASWFALLSWPMAVGSIAGRSVILVLALLFSALALSTGSIRGRSWLLLAWLSPAGNSQGGVCCV